MYQVNACFDVVTVVTKDPTWFQRLMGKDAQSLTVSRDGKLSFVIASISDVVSKLNYLVGDLSTIKDMTIVKM